MFVTAASSNHFKSAIQFIRSLKGAPVIFYDIGLTSEEADVIKRMPVEYRVFDWSKVSDWGRLMSPNAGSYAWKPVIIYDVFHENHDLLIWCDAGNMVYDRNILENCVRQHVIYTGTSSGELSRYTHKACLDGMNMTEKQRSYRMRNAACVGFVTNDYTAQKFVYDWKLYSTRRELMQGHSDNHRWDQSILSCLFYRYGRTDCPSTIGYTIHNDCD